MKRVQQGFTLIELMIVVAIIGILAAIAIPAYQDYTKRAHVGEGLQLAAGSKTAIAEYYASNGVWPSTNASAGIASATDINGNAVVSVTVDDGVLTVAYNEKVASGAALIITPTAASGSITWTCAIASGNTEMSSKWLPSNCR